MSPRWRKVGRDLLQDRSRTALAVLALALGTFGVGADLAATAVLEREIDASFASALPPSVVLKLSGPGADRALAREVEGLPGVLAAEPRGAVEGRVAEGPDTWRRMLLFAVDNFTAQRVSALHPERGAAAPSEGELLLERSALKLLGAEVGSMVTVRTAEGPPATLRVAGVVHDPAQSPGWMDGMGYGYLTPAGLEALGVRPALDELRVRVAPGSAPAEVGARVWALCEARGRPVAWVDARQQARHPHADQMESLLVLFGAFGALTLVLGGLLAASVVSSLLRHQLRQLGVMKALGAGDGQLLVLGLGGVALLAAAALAVSLPAALLAGQAYARFVGGVLNLRVASLAVPLWVPVAQGAAGLLVPLLSAAWPVWQVSRLTVLESLGGGARAVAPPPLAVGPDWLRQAARTPGRLALTAGILAVGGATFVSALNVGEAWQATVDGLFRARRYQLQVVFSRPVPSAAAEAALAGVEGVRAVESWDSALATVRRPGGEVHFTLTGAPPATAMVELPVLEGRWLRPGDVDALVINHELAQDAQAGLRVGQAVELEVAGRPVRLTVVGVVRELGVRRRGQHLPASAYVAREALQGWTGAPGRATSALVVAADPGPAGQAALRPRVERALEAAGLPRTIVQPATARRKELLDHLVVIRDFLLAMALLVAAVGGLALGTAMSLTILERRRELGVMRALGATPAQLQRRVVGEGVGVAAASWVLALGLAAPLTLAIGDVAGRTYVHVPLELSVSVAGVLGWLLLVLGIGVLASALPLWRALRGPVADALRSE